MPELIAHRGASADRPENSMAAFERAIALGADAVELDVHLTADARLVVHHDPIVRDGVRSAAIQSLTLRELSAFRVRGEPIPTLDDVVAGVAGRLRIYCELKGPGTARPAVGLLGPLGAGAAVHSFDHRMVAEARAAAPAVPRGILETSYHLDPVAGLRAVDGRDLWQQEALIDAPLVALVHEAGARVIAWTVNDPVRVRQLVGLGVDAICTDDVAAVRRALAAS
jgi:glycerophosphoryl diester phosphodiesterase